MTLLLAQPETSIYPKLCHAINRWLWRWSPWHLQTSVLQLVAEREAKRLELDCLRREVRAVEHSLQSYRKANVVPRIVVEDHRTRNTGRF